MAQTTSPLPRLVRNLNLSRCWRTNTFPQKNHLTFDIGKVPDCKGDGSDSSEEVAEVVLNHVKRVFEHLQSIAIGFYVIGVGTGDS